MEHCPGLELSESYRIAFRRLLNDMTSDGQWRVFAGSLRAVGKALDKQNQIEKGRQSSEHNVATSVCEDAHGG